MSSVDKLAFVLEATYGPLWKGRAATVQRRLERLFGKLDQKELASRKNQHFRWMREGAKRRTRALEELCNAIEQQFKLQIQPEWFVDNNLSAIAFAGKLGYDEIDYDYAMQDLKLNQANPEPERLSDMNQNERMKDGIWLVKRFTDEARTTRQSTCIFVTTDQMLEFRRDGKQAPRASHFAYLFAPFGGQGKNKSTRIRATKYVGRGAAVANSLVFKFNSEGRTPADEAYMWIMACDDEQTSYSGGYVSKSIDKKNRPGVRWIDLTYLTSDVSVHSIDQHCERHVRSADELAEERRPASPCVDPRPKDVLQETRERRSAIKPLGPLLAPQMAPSATPPAAPKAKAQSGDGPRPLRRT